MPIDSFCYATNERNYGPDLRYRPAPDNSRKIKKLKRKIKKLRRKIKKLKRE